MVQLKFFISAVFVAGFFAFLYYWEIPARMLNPAGFLPEPNQGTELIRYVLHCGLFLLLFEATRTDFKTMMISDTVTVLGTVIAVGAALLFSGTALPSTKMFWDGFQLIVSENLVPLDLYSPNIVPNNTILPPFSVWIISSILWWVWCFAMLDRFWYRKLSFRKNWVIFWRHLYRSPRTKFYLAAAVIAPLCFVLNPSIALLSSLVGMTAGLLLFWGARIICSIAAGQEAMGFGDVTLMAMVGAFLGWQPVILIFFLSPFAGLIFGVIRAVLYGDHCLPFGPFLSLATVFVVIGWGWLWNQTADIFSLGGVFIATAMLVCLILMGVLLKGLIALRRR